MEEEAKWVSESEIERVSAQAVARYYVRAGGGEQSEFCNKQLASYKRRTCVRTPNNSSTHDGLTTHSARTRTRAHTHARARRSRV